GAGVPPRGPRRRQGPSPPPGLGHGAPGTWMTGQKNSRTGELPIVSQPFWAYDWTASALVSWTGVTFQVTGNTIQRPPLKSVSPGFASATFTSPAPRA